MKYFWCVQATVKTRNGTRYLLTGVRLFEGQAAHAGVKHKNFEQRPTCVAVAVVFDVGKPLSTTVVWSYLSSR